jgi:hypothetical protein
VRTWGIAQDDNILLILLFSSSSLKYQIFAFFHPSPPTHNYLGNVFFRMLQVERVV